MGQYWKFFNVSMRQEYETNGGPKASFLHFKQGFLVRSITMPRRSSKGMAHLRRLTSTPTTIDNSKGLLCLPDELLLDIMERHGLTLDELAVLATTCRRLFNLLSKQIDLYRVIWSAPWLMSRIVCGGDKAEYEDFPAALLNAQERATIETKVKEGEDGVDYGGLELLDLRTAACFRGVCSYDPSWLNKFGDTDLEVFKSIVEITFPPREDWVLINETKKEFVRASAIAKLAGKPNDAQPFLPCCRVDLGHALLTRICWSTEQLVDMPRRSKLKMHRGSWVGDRFCITTMDRRSMPSEGEEPWEWKDVSDEVVRDLVQVYRAIWGKNWLTEIEGKRHRADYTELYWYGSDGEDHLASYCRGIESPGFPLPSWLL